MPHRRKGYVFEDFGDVSVTRLLPDEVDVNFDMAAYAYEIKLYLLVVNTLFRISLGHVPNLCSDNPS